MSDISKERTRETGEAILLISLLAVYFTGSYKYLPAVIAILVLCMVWPGFFRPFAKLWFGLSHALGTINTKVLLTIVFFVLVVPIGCVRRLFGADAMQLKKWKKGASSVFVERGHVFGPGDLENPY